MYDFIQQQIFDKFLNFVTQFIIFCLKLIEIIIAAIFEPYFRFS